MRRKQAAERVGAWADAGGGGLCAAAAADRASISDAPARDGADVGSDDGGAATDGAAGGIAPLVDGEIDPVWEMASPLELPLTWGIRGQEPAYPAQLRAVYDDENDLLSGAVARRRPADDAETLRSWRTS